AQVLRSNSVRQSSNYDVRIATPLVLDCDPGHDDAMAMLLAVDDPPVELLGVTTLAGNQTVDKCTLNARRVLSLAGVSHIPGRACRRPAAGPTVPRSLRL